MHVRPATLVLILCLLVIVGIGTWGGTWPRDAPPAPRNAPAAADQVEIPGIDWARLGTLTRERVAVKGTEDEWVGLEELLQSLDTFIQAATEAGTGEPIDQEHFLTLGQGFKQWGWKSGDKADLFWSAIQKASDEPEVWGRVLGALGPVITAGAYVNGLEVRPELVERMRQVQSELTGAHGEARVKLEKEREKLQDAIAMIDRRG